MSIPKTIGKYQLETLLGEGGMGQVYKAFDPRVRRHLAVKILRTEGLSDARKEREFKERFFREGQICGSLNHPNIVTIYEMDEASGELFIAMEFIKGRPLSDLIGDVGALSTQQQLDLLKQVAGALDYAHMLGVVHRDLKPSNIIWSDFGQAKITDFGIAKLLEGHEAKLTQPGMFVGTPRYASPEQIESRDVSSKSDIFSFGVLTYETLAGVPPFPGSSISEILYKIAAGNINYVPIDRKLGIANQRIRDIFQRVFHVQPEKRYRKAGDFFAALDHAIQMGSENPAPPASPSETIRMSLVADPDSTAPLKMDLQTDISPEKVQHHRQKPLAPPPNLATNQSDNRPPHLGANSMNSRPPDNTPPIPSQTLRMPRSFLDPSDEEVERIAPSPPSGDTVKRPVPPIFNQANPNPPPTPPPPSAPPQLQQPVAYTSQRPPSAPATNQHVRSHPPPSYHYSEDDEPKSGPWWILGVVAILGCFSLLGWLAWPELKTLFGDDTSTQVAANNLSADTTLEGTLQQADNPLPDPASPAIRDDDFHEQDPTEDSDEVQPLSEEPDAPSPLATEQDVLPQPLETKPETPLETKTEKRPPPVESKPTQPKPKPKPKLPERSEPETAPKQQVIQPVVTRRVTPVFPQAGKDAGIEGEVILEAELRFDGKVGNISVLKTLGQSRYGFEDAAVKALLDYEFVPGRIDGKQATIRKKFHFKFQLSERRQVDGKRFAELVDNTLKSENKPQPVPSTNGIQRPVFTKKVPPIFPKAGYDAGMTGNVVLRATLKKDGSMGEIQVISGLGDGQFGFEDAAIDALKQWQFRPGKINGTPSDMPIQVSLQFKLKQPD